MVEDWQNGGFGIYIHWPFCQSKCPYCDFNSHVTKSIDQSRWNRAYLREIDRYAKIVPDRPLTSVYFGGGTPSLMDPDLVASIMARIRKHWSVTNDFEATLEANPGSVEAGRFREYSDAGINRISIGIQALNDRDLKKLGRLHSVSEALKALDIAKAHFDRVNFDLIYARQNQSLDDWKSELTQALSVAADHLSLYQLTIEKNTAFGDRYRRGGLLGLPNDDQSFDMYQATIDICGEAGFHAYEVSNFAKPGSESRHNLVYWRYGDFIGIGPGAHGRLSYSNSRFATEGYSNPAKWLSLSENGLPEKDTCRISSQEQAEEFLMMGLRLSDGIDPRRFKSLSGKDLLKETVDHLEEIEMIHQGDNRIVVTDQGRMVLNSVIKGFLSD